MTKYRLGALLENGNKFSSKLNVLAIFFDSASLEDVTIIQFYFGKHSG